jgi:hypothetical protein
MKMEAAGSFRNFGKFIPNYTASLAQTDGQRIGSDFGGGGRGQFDIAFVICLHSRDGGRPRIVSSQSRQCPRRDQKATPPTPPKLVAPSL